MLNHSHISSHLLLKLVSWRGNAMTIERLQRRLEHSLSQLFPKETTYSKFVQPVRLTKTLQVLERKFDDLENAIPVDAKIFKTISKLEHSGFEQFTRRDWKNLAWALSKVLQDTQEKLIFNDIGKRIVQHFNQAEQSIINLVYFPLLYSYFALAKEDIAAKPAVWLTLRDILNRHKSNVYKSTQRPKQWMTTLIDHADILSDTPTQAFVKQFLQDNDASGIQKELESLRIAPNSWFWDDLIKSSIQSIRQMNEKDYFKSIARFITLSEQNSLYRRDILAALLERYAKTSERDKVHETLKQMALDQWGNPQYDSSAGWNNVNPDTKRMVVQWFVKADLEAFFNLFSEKADVQRFEYWMRYIDQISFSQIFLGTSALNSTRHQHLNFRKMNRGRLKELSGSTTSTNNVFLLKIGNIYIVDFSEKGHACYFYNRLPYKDYVGRIDIKSLRNQETCIDRQTRNGNWQPRFDNALARLGIFSRNRR